MHTKVGGKRRKLTTSNTLTPYTPLPLHHTHTHTLFYVVRALLAGAVCDDGRREQGHQRGRPEAQVLLLLHQRRRRGPARRLRPRHRLGHDVVIIILSFMY